MTWPLDGVESLFEVFNLLVFSPDQSLLRRLKLSRQPVCHITSGENTYNVLLGFRLDLRASASEFERLQGLGAVLLLGRNGADDANVRVAAKCILKQMREL